MNKHEEKSLKYCVSNCEEVYLPNYLFISSEYMLKKFLCSINYRTNTR